MSTPVDHAASLRDVLVAHADELGRPDRFWVFYSCRDDQSSAARITEVSPIANPTIQPATS
jgi:hypothetical protein